MPDQPSQSLIDALMGHFRAKGQEMATMTPADQWKQFGIGALTLAPLGIASRAGATMGNDAVIANQLTRAHPYESAADVQSKLNRMPSSPERDELLVQAIANSAREARAMRRGGDIARQNYELNKLRASLNEFEPANDAARPRPSLVRE